jgi:hypothetical protein
MEERPENAEQPIETSEDRGDDAGGSPLTVGRSSRRALLVRSAKKIAYTAPVVLLFRPRQAVAASGSNLPGAGRVEPLIRPALPQFGAPAAPGIPVVPAAPGAVLP